MKEEIAAAVVFLTRLIRQNDSIPKEKADEFSDHLSELLVEKFKNHWYAENPHKGQGYRCIRVNPAGPIDPVLKKASTLCGLKYSDLGLPTELTVWVDPQEVSCRFGETHGSFCMLASLKDGNLEIQAHKVDIGGLVAEQQKRNKRHINIVTTRINKPRPQYQKNIPFHFIPYPTMGNHHDGQIFNYQPNFFQNLHVAGFNPFNPHPFHNNRHNNKNRNKGSFNGNCGGYSGNKANILNQNHRCNYHMKLATNPNSNDEMKLATNPNSNNEMKLATNPNSNNQMKLATNPNSNNQMKLATNPNMQSKAKSHLVRGKQNRADHIKVGSNKTIGV